MASCVASWWCHLIQLDNLLADTKRNKHVIITSKQCFDVKCFDVIIRCLLRFVFVRITYAHNLRFGVFCRGLLPTDFAQMCQD